jgi:NAD+ diphosphatase
VAVTKHNRILLARAFRFPMKIYSVIAGFVEPGETLEQCIRREIMEEVNIEVRNIRYFGSQPWPFPNSLMIAFTAEYAGGEIRIDNREIMDAGWFRIHELPNIPDKVSIARRLIDSFIQSHT